MVLVALLMIACSKNTSPNNPVLPTKDTITWSFNTATSTLTINGSGAMENYDEKTNLPPWSQYNTQIKQVQIENGVTSIEVAAFMSCSSLSSVTISNSVTSIGAGAFQGCTALSSITIPKSVTSIGNLAFYGCSLNSITCLNPTPIAITDYVFANVNTISCILSSFCFCCTVPASAGME